MTTIASTISTREIMPTATSNSSENPSQRSNPTSDDRGANNSHGSTRKGTQPGTPQPSANALTGVPSGRGTTIPDTQNLYDVLAGSAPNEQRNGSR